MQHQHDIISWLIPIGCNWQLIEAVTGRHSVRGFLQNLWCCLKSVTTYHVLFFMFCFGFFVVFFFPLSQPNVRLPFLSYDGLFKNKKVSILQRESSAENHGRSQLNLLTKLNCVIIDWFVLIYITCAYYNWSMILDLFIRFNAVYV